MKTTIKTKSGICVFLSGLLLLTAETLIAQVARPPECTVFGTGERTQLCNAAASDIVRLDRKSVFESDFNYGYRFTYAVSIIGAGEIVIEAGNDNGLYDVYHDREDIKEFEIMAETLVIRSPLRLRGTNVSIHARDLRFEGSGQVITTPTQKDLRAQDAERTPEGVLTRNAGDGEDALDAGSVEVNISTFTDTSGNGLDKFVLVGGKGQGAGKGIHGVNGETAVYWSNGTFTFTAGLGDTATYSPPAGYYVTYWDKKGQTDSGDRSWRSRANGTDGVPAGTPGRGGGGGTLTTNHLGVSWAGEGGRAGDLGIPPASPGHSSTLFCEGGNRGWPSRSVHIQSYTSGLFEQNAHIREIDIVDGEHGFTTEAGTSYPVSTANGGTAGTRVVTWNSYSWLNPQLLRQILGTVKDDYLQNRIAEAEAALADYSGVVEHLRADTAAWNAAPEVLRYELSQMYDEMQILRQQIANGLDYFGNPNGWVPMLSFEVGLRLFDQEIGRALNTIYLAKWITKKQDEASVTLAALATVRNNLKTEIEEAKTSYDSALNELEGFSGQASAIHLRVINLQNRLKEEDRKLRDQAMENTAPSDWEVGLRVGLKVSGTICEMVPMYQPVLGSVGGALNLASEYDPDAPWDTVTGLFELTQAYAGSAIEASARDQQAQKDGVVSATLDGPGGSAARMQNLQNLSQAAGALSNGIKGISSVVEQSKAPQSEVEAELDRLRRANPAYNALVEDIRQLLNDKREFADQITAASNRIASLSDLITRDILAIDAMDVTIGEQSTVIDSRVNAYLKDMERRAFDRLLKYHYYMAKAYEYRLVTPYTATLDLEPLFNKIDQIATAGTPDGILDAGQIELLESVYRDLIATTTEKIIDDYNSSPSIPGSSFTYTLAPAEIAILNRGESFNLNLFERGYFLPAEEDVRIVNLEVLPTGGMTTELASGGSYASPAYVDLCIEHSGISNVKQNGEIIQFRHYNKSTRNAITWWSRYEPGPNSIAPTPPHPAQDSLLLALVPGLSSSEQLLYSRPSAWADLRVSRTGRNGGVTFGLGDAAAPINITGVILRITYDRKFRTTSPNVREFNVAARPFDSEDPAAEQDSLYPGFEVSEIDRNGRGDAEGSFLRIYNYNNPGLVQLTAQETYGSLGFLKWTDKGVDAGVDPTISLSSTADHQLVAYYVPLAPVVTSPLTATGVVGAAFQYQIRANYNPVSFDATGLPAGLSVDPVTGVISGILMTTGSFNVGLEATNPAGSDNDDTLVLTIISPVTYNLVYAGTGGVSATGFITFDSAIQPNPGNYFNQPTGTAGVLDFELTVVGAASGNGTFDLTDVTHWSWDAPGAVDFHSDLVGQLSTFNLGTSGGSPGAPVGVALFTIATNGGGGDQLTLVSMTPAVTPLEFKVTSFAFDRDTNRVTMTWTSAGGERFEIQASDDFGPDTPFAAVVTAITGTGGSTTHSFVDPEAEGKDKRFYRVVKP